jgi:hypothetical protein
MAGRLTFQNPRRGFRRSGAHERRAVDAYIFRELRTKAGSNSAYPLAEVEPKASRCNGLEISLISLKIHHKTYRFNKPVALGSHRLMLLSQILICHLRRHLSKEQSERPISTVCCA